MKQAHEKSISAVATYDDIVLTGSSDGTVKAWKLEGMDEQSGWCTPKSPPRCSYLLHRKVKKYPDSGFQKAIPFEYPSYSFASVNW